MTFNLAELSTEWLLTQAELSTGWLLSYLKALQDNF